MVFSLLIKHLATPKDLNISNIYNDINLIEGVERAHDLHVWAISPGNIAITVHVSINSDVLSSEQETILHKIQEMFCTKYTIHHSTIQIEKKESIHCNPINCVTK